MTNNRRSSREKRPTQKIVLSRNAETEEAERNAKAQRRRAEQAKRTQRRQDRARGIAIEGTPQDRRQDLVLTSRPVVSKPKATKQLAQRRGKVPPPPLPHQRSTSRGRSRSPRSRNSQDMDLEQQSGSRESSLFAQCPPPAQPRHRLSVTPSLSNRSQSQTPFRSPSPTSGSKRQHSPDIDDPLNELFAKVPRTHKGRPKASDYNEVQQEVIVLANRAYRCLLATQNGFPDTSTEIRQVKKAWAAALRIKAFNPTIPLIPGTFGVIRLRGWQLRGEAKTKATLLVRPIYGFRSGRGRKTIAANRTLAESLKHEGGFLYKTLGDGTPQAPHRGLYQNPIIQELINALWFRRKNDIGIDFSDMFDPIPIEAIAFVLTAVECAIDEWATGIKTDVPFGAEEYKDIYCAHYRSLREFEILQSTQKRNFLKRMCERLYINGRDHAGVPPKTVENRFAVPRTALEAAAKEYEEEYDEEECEAEEYEAEEYEVEEYGAEEYEEEEYELEEEEYEEEAEEATEEPAEEPGNAL